jgi:hypothetical protein
MQIRVRAPPRSGARRGKRRSVSKADLKDSQLPVTDPTPEVLLLPLKLKDRGKLPPASPRQSSTVHPPGQRRRILKVGNPFTET